MVLLDRKKAIPTLIGDNNRFLIISGLAGPAKDIGFLTKESPNTFLFGGAMGGALPTSLGLALSRPNDRVLCVSGDGDVLMSMGCLATIATIKPKNLIIICVDNALYLETGGQTSHTGLGVNLDMIAKGCGFPITKTIAISSYFFYQRILIVVIRSCIKYFIVFLFRLQNFIKRQVK